MKNLFLALAIGVACVGEVEADVVTNSGPILDLEAAKKLALQNHPQIAAANYRVLAAREVVKESQAGFFPNVNLFANGVAAGSEDTRILAGGLNNPSVFDRVAGGLAVSQLITDFGHTANLAASSRFQAEAENENADATREEVLLHAEVSYFSALEAQAVLQVAQKTFHTRQLLADQVTLLASNKLKSELDVSFARIALEQGRLLLERAQNDASASMTTLSTSLGLHEPKRFQLVEQSPTDFSLTNDVAQMVETALAQRPELMSLRAEHEASLRYAKSQRDSRLPTVSAIGVMGDTPAHDSHLPDHYAAGGIQISLPLFAGGLYTARQHEAEYRTQSDKQLLRAAEDNIVRDVHLGWLNVNNALEELHTTEQLVRNSSEAYDLAEARYKIGSSSIVELSQAQLSLTSAQIADTNARYKVLIQQANLNREIGALH